MKYTLSFMPKIKIGVLIFPGTNCNIETKRALEKAGLEATYIWHEEDKIPKDIKGIVIPGGFSYGDYLEAGKIASLSPIMRNVSEAGQKGMPIIGICNGFQILCASNLLEGTFIMNMKGKFISRWAEIIVEDTDTPFTCDIKKGDILKMPIAHKFGNYFYRNKKPRVIFRYKENPNGSADDIAGISSPKGNIVGMMPHPERATGLISQDGLKIFLSIKKWFS